MPLLNQKPVKYKIRCPSTMVGVGLTPSDAQKQFFYYPLTNELFSDYTEYVNRIILYKQQIWTCKYTAKERLTYEEALRCERKHLSRLIHEKFPRHILKPICELVRKMQVNMGEVKLLVDEIHDRYLTQFLEAEEVMCQFEGYNELVLVRVIRLEDRQQGFYKIKIIQPGEDELDEQLSVFDRSEQSFHVVHSNNLFRFGDDNVSRSTLFQWLNEWTLPNVDTGLLELRPELVEYYLIDDSSNTPSNIEQIANTPGAIVETTARAGGPGRGRTFAGNGAPITVATNGTSIMESPVSQASSSNLITPSNVPSSSLTRHERTASERLKHSVHADHKFPISIPFKESIKAEDSESSNDSLLIALPQELLNRALEVWNFCFAFREYIECSSFPFFDFQQALLYIHDETKGEEPSPLLHSILSSLLIFLLTRERTANSKTEINKVIQRMKKSFNEMLEAERDESAEKFSDLNSRSVSVNNEAVFRLCDNWKYLSCIVLKEYWALFLSERVEEVAELREEHNFDESKFFELSAQQRLFVLHVLVDQCLQLQITKQFLKIKIMNARKQKQTAAVAEEFNTSGLVPCRIISLGRDRFNNQYWFFPGFTGCIFVERVKLLGSGDLNGRANTNDGCSTSDDFYIDREKPKMIEYGVISSGDQLQELENWLNPSDSSERKLRNKLIKNGAAIRRTMKHMSLMRQQGDSEQVKEELSQLRKSLEAKAARLNAEEETEETDDQSSDEGSDDEEEQQDDQNGEKDDHVDDADVSSTRKTRAAARKRSVRDLKSDGESDDGSESPPAKRPRRRRGTSSKQQQTQNSANETTDKERRSQRLVQKKNTNNVEVKQETVKSRSKAVLKRDSSSKQGTTSTKGIPKNQKQGTSSNRPQKNTASPVKSESSEKSDKKRIATTENDESVIFPKFLSENSHKYYINEYDFAYLKMMEDEEVEQEEGEEEQDDPEEQQCQSSDQNEEENDQEEQHTSMADNDIEPEPETEETNNSIDDE